MGSRARKCVLFVGAVVVLAVAVIAGAGDLAPIPDTPAGGALRAWLEAVRSGDADRAKEHYRESFTESFHEAVPLGRYMAIVGQVGNALRASEIEAIDQTDDHRLIAHAHLAEGAWLDIVLSVDPKSDDRIGGLMVRPGEAPDLAAKSYSEWQTLRELVTSVYQDRGLPALAAAWVRGSDIVDSAVVGVRQHGVDEKAVLTDLFHVGSVTKSMTATLIARLIEQGKLEWKTTIGDALPEMEMLDAYRPVTLEQILRHRGGIPQALTFDGAEMKRLTELEGSAIEQRAAFLAEILQLEPVAKPGAAEHYSNAGFALLGHIAETVGGKSWNELLEREVFAPLGLGSAGFDWPATEARPHQPRGHFGKAGDLVVQGLQDYPLGEFISPAGNVHCTIEDLARYAAFHLAGLRGRDGALKAKTVKRLHAAPKGTDYAGGWVVTRDCRGEPMHWHNGSAGTFYAHVALFPKSDEAIVVATNAGEGEAVAVRLIETVRGRSEGKKQKWRPKVRVRITR